eukprot:m.135383 g.135383  ORF g.135383 m.135383 type:complete len:783 (+) comp15991_c0_seq1:58-2406(+)
MAELDSTLQVVQPVTSTSPPSSPTRKAAAIADEAIGQQPRSRPNSHSSSESLPHLGNNEFEDSQQCDETMDVEQAGSIPEDAEDLDSEHEDTGKGMSGLAKSFKSLVGAKDDKFLFALFKNLPKGEHLLEDYSCALQRDILVHGRLYVTQNYLSFYSNIFGWETVLSINCQEIDLIKKEKTALVIPNAIQVNLKDGTKYFFASFMARDTSFRCLFKVWQNALLPEPLSATSLIARTTKDWRGNMSAVNSPNKAAKRRARRNGRESPAAGSKAWRRMHRASPLPAGHADSGHLSDSSIPSTSSLQAVSAPSTFLSPQPRRRSELRAASPDPSLDMAEHENGEPDNIVLSNGALPTRAQASVTEPSQTEPNDSPEQVSVQPTSTLRHRRRERKSPQTVPTLLEREEDAVPSTATLACDFGRTLLNETYDCSLECARRLLLEHSIVYDRVYKELKTTEIKAGEWVSNDDGLLARDLSYKLSLNYSFGPKSTVGEEHQVQVEHAERDFVVVDTEVFTPKVPYGDNFYNALRYVLQNKGDGTTHVTVCGIIKYRKSQPWGMIRRLIESNAYSGLENYWKLLSKAMLDVLSNMDMSSRFAGSELNRPLTGSLSELAQAGVETVTSTVTTHEGGRVVSHSRHASVASILSERAAFERALSHASDASRRPPPTAAVNEPVEPSTASLPTPHEEFVRSRTSSVSSRIEHPTPPAVQVPPMSLSSSNTATPPLVLALLVLVGVLLLTNAFLFYKVLSLEERVAGQPPVSVDSQALQDAVAGLSALKDALARL